MEKFKKELFHQIFQSAPLTRNSKKQKWTKDRENIFAILWISALAEACSLCVARVTFHIFSPNLGHLRRTLHDSAVTAGCKQQQPHLHIITQKILINDNKE